MTSSPRIPFLRVEFQWNADGGVVDTAVVTSGGAPSQPLAMYGTADGVVHLRRLSDAGAAVGGADVSGEPDAFGTPGGPTSVSFADTSTDNALGQLFVAHNDAGGVEIAHFDETGPGAVLSGSPTLPADAGDDQGIASVRFMAGERTICTDTAAPYDCAYRLGAGDVGRTTLVAVATDTAGQTAAALRSVQVSRFASPGVSARTTPARDRRRPFRFTTSGRVRVPAGVSRSGACTGGRVSVQLKAARKTISTRRVALTRTCAYRSSVSFRSRKRLPRSGRLTVRVRFLGNAVLGPRSAKTTVVRTR